MGVYSNMRSSVLGQLLVGTLTCQDPTDPSLSWKCSWKCVEFELPQPILWQEDVHYSPPAFVCIAKHRHPEDAVTESPYTKQKNDFSRISYLLKYSQEIRFHNLKFPHSNTHLLNLDLLRSSYPVMSWSQIWSSLSQRSSRPTIAKP